VNLRAELVTPDNVVEFFDKNEVPVDMGLLSLDIDGDEFHLLRNVLLSGRYRPAVIVVEHGHGFWWPKMMMPMDKAYVPRVRKKLEFFQFERVSFDADSQNEEIETDVLSSI
jgi:hypothetical protein